MRLRAAITTLILTVLATMALAGPVAQRRDVYSQPDGTTFNVKLRGDEWIKLRTTEDGCAIIKDHNGWWCYGVYNNEDKIECTPYHVGDPVPADVLSSSRNIPYRALNSRASNKRMVCEANLQAQRQIIRRQAAATKSSGTKIHQRGLALLVEFNDTKFRFTKEDFYDLLNKKDYKGTGSAKDYYEQQFGDGWEFTFDVSEIITLEWPAEHYGKNDADEQDVRPWDMVAEACRIADESIDFSQYDLDDDGFVDNVYIFYAGLSEAENTELKDLIWPHQYYIYRGKGIRLSCDGKQIDRYACSAEITGERSLTGIGSFCHEYGHTFGLVDLYDTDYDSDGDWAAGVWRTTSLMDGGNYNNNSATPPCFNCIEREMLGLSEAIILEEGKSYTLEPIHKNGSYCRLESDTPGEYYLFECRSNQSWDRYIGGKGMLVYHIDKNETVTINGYNHSSWSMNMVNTSSSHQCADLVEADGRIDMILDIEDLYGDISGIFFPRSNVTALGTPGSPKLDFWNGRSSDLAVIGIKTVGDNITFNVSDKNKVQDVPSVVGAQFMTFPDGVIISFESSKPALKDCKAIVEWRRNGSPAPYETIYPKEYAPGKYACKIDGLTSGNISYETHIRFEYGGASSGSYKLPFMTKRKPSVDWPYIYIADSQIKPDTGLALHVVNASDAAQIKWYFDDVEISPDGDYFFRPAKDGQLKAVVIWEDGDTDKIVKTIKVSMP